MAERKTATRGKQAKSKGFTDEERAAMGAPGAECGSAPRLAGEEGRRGKRPAREDRRDAEPDRAMAERVHAVVTVAHGPFAEHLVRDARVCQGGQGRLLLHSCVEVQGEVRDVRLQRHGKPRRRRYVADLLCVEGVDRREEAKISALRESGELRTELALGPGRSGCRGSRRHAAALVRSSCRASDTCGCCVPGRTRAGGQLARCRVAGDSAHPGEVGRCWRLTLLHDDVSELSQGAPALPLGCGCRRTSPHPGSGHAGCRRPAGRACRSRRG